MFPWQIHLKLCCTVCPNSVFFYVLILCQTKVYFSADSEEFIHPMPTLVNFEAYQKKGHLSLGIINKV